ncbi:hypothetical protein [Nonomuraea sp. NPDC049480]|uniref:hypothetical protein n=1 Tax=Nonomuraea sp. NPDC049480 TaxID=3364353 RepID=UPI00378E2253
MRRALVLGEGGLTGIAWELGMPAGLDEHGVDLSAPVTRAGGPVETVEQQRSRLAAAQAVASHRTRPPERRSASAC